MREEEQLLVAALENGTVIDHIPTDKVFQVVSLLGLESLETPFTIGANLESGKMGRKGIIKISDRFFTSEEVGKLSIVAPNIDLCTIRNYKVVAKQKVELPGEVVGLVKCTNSKCITNHEPMQTRFDVMDKNQVTLRCFYCGKYVDPEQITLI